MDEEQEKQTVEEPETQAPETKEEPVAEEAAQDKFNVQVINLLQELCDTVKALKVEEAREEAPEEAEDASQFDVLLDE